MTRHECLLTLSQPCVASFGGDQFKDHQMHLLAGYFAMFYFSINAGSVFSTILTPKLRAEVQCFGDEECYPLAFGLPAILMIIAVVIFMLGKRLYVIQIPERNIVLDAFRATKIGLKHKLGRLLGRQGTSSLVCPAHPYPLPGAHHLHWLDPAAKTYGQGFIGDLKMVFRVLVIFLPMPVYWALFDQQVLN